ncbi:Retrovirus-related Pol polyprotein from transposon 17.6 [Araneus ventricosus]|uniref:Retrovirus-related Pol polyprotein from transposon 17.6 n=1 Tax=Araneus ventricosus TaxID=182803 RepID=A0A4Y2URS0_ARAVE|nr:Retrovirus-related Pol polyprotein from transposon 17.6 [Araneus ventricosus]
MKDVLQDKDKCAQLLLNSIGASNYNILAALIAPKAPNELPYDNLFKVLENHLAPKRSCLVSQHYFLSTYQKQYSSISDFVADLRRDIAECKFIVACECSKNVSVADIFLRAQFIRGIKDSWIKEQILQSELTDFNEIVDKAIAFETSKIDCRELSKSNTTGLKDINKIAKRNRQSKNVKTSFRNQTTNQKHLASNYRKKTKKPFLDFEKLGINNLCLRCGNNSHLSRECRSNPNNLKCRACKSTGHVQKVCIKTILNANRSNGPNLANHVKTYQDIGVNAIVNIYDNRTSESAEDATKYFISVKIENRYQKFEVDTGACYTLIPDTQFKRLRSLFWYPRLGWVPLLMCGTQRNSQPNRGYQNRPLSIKRQLEPTEIAFRSYTENVFLLLGRVRVKVEHKGHVSFEDLYIVPDQTTGNEIQNEIFSIQNITDIEKHFPEVFEQKVGCVPNFTVKLKLCDGTKLNYIPKRNVPYALREKVDKELDSLETAGIISKSITIDWGSPLVEIPKGDVREMRTVRLRVDYKAGVNDLLMNVNYPIKKINEVLNSLRHSKYFCKLDLFKVYLHFQTDEESSIIQTISTHRGAYKRNKLSFRIKTTPAEFNRVIDQILNGLPKTIAYFDDIVVHIKTKDECSKNLFACLERLREYVLHLNIKKCTFFQTRIEYLVHVVENNKISLSPSKVEAIIRIQQPRNVQELRQFLGMVAYYSRFIPDVSTITYPLRKILRKNQKFYRNTEREQAFLQLKEEISSDRVLIPFDPELPVTLATDASPVRVAAVLSHIVDNVEKSVAFASRSLTEAERNYSQLHKEALAIIFGVSHFINYIYDRHFVLITDNQPLSIIFHPKTGFPRMISARLLRYASFLA